MLKSVRQRRSVQHGPASGAAQLAGGNGRACRRPECTAAASQPPTACEHVEPTDGQRGAACKQSSAYPATGYLSDGGAARGLAGGVRSECTVKHLAGCVPAHICARIARTKAGPQHARPPQMLARLLRSTATDGRAHSPTHRARAAAVPYSCAAENLRMQVRAGTGFQRNTRRSWVDFGRSLNRLGSLQHPLPWFSHRRRQTTTTLHRHRCSYVLDPSVRPVAWAQRRGGVMVHVQSPGHRSRHRRGGAGTGRACQWALLLTVEPAFRRRGRP